MTSLKAVMIGNYDYCLVALSVLLAILGAYCTIDLAGQVTVAQGKDRPFWLIGGAAAMGVGTWSMHYTGMLAFCLPVPVQHDWPWALSHLLTAEPFVHSAVPVSSLL